MKEILDEWNKNMGKMWEPWQKMMGGSDWMKVESPHQVKWSAWMSAMRSSYDVNASWWQMFLDQTEEVFFKTYKESPFYSKTVEDQMRELGGNIRKGQNLQMDSVKEYLDKMETLLKDKEEQG
jgi:hypothetical protein